MRTIFLGMMTQERVPPPLQGRTALVTGAARRVGAEIVRHLHAAGANVVIHCNRSLEQARALAAGLESGRSRCRRWGPGPAGRRSRRSRRRPGR